MITKINISNIILDHLGTLKNDQGTAYLKADIALFYFVPLILASYLAIGVDIDIGKFSTTLSAIFSIFAALLFNLLLLIYTIFDKKNEKIKNDVDYDRKEKIRINLIKEIYSNISYSIFISLICLIFVVLSNNVSGYTEKTFSFYTYFFSINFFLTLLMVLKRIHVLLSDEFANHSS